MKTMKHFDLRRVLALLLVISMLLTGNVGLITAYAAADGDTCDGEDHTQGSAVSSQENIRVCSCDPAPVEGEGHGEGCAFYVAPAEPEKVCTCDPAPAEGEGHGDGCAFYVAPDDQEKSPTVDGDQVENGQLQAPGVSAAEDGGPVMTAAFYQTIDRENIKLELGSGVNRIENWEKDALQYLKLSLSGLGDLSEGEQYRLVISMDSAVSIQDFVGDKSYSWSSKTAFTANAAIPVNLNGTYQTNACTAVFDIAPEISEVDLPLTVEYDWAIWNQNKGAELGYSTEYLSTPAPLLTLELRKVSTDGAETAVNTLKLDGATAGTEGQKTSGYSSSLIGDSPASGLNASQTLKIRYAVNKDYLCQGYKIVISLPYYTHTDGKVYAMVFDESQDSFSVTGGKANIKKEYGVDPETGANTVTLTFPGIYYTSANFSHVGYRLPDVTELDQLRQTFDFTNGTITAYVGDAVIGSHSFSTKMYPSAAEIRAVKTQSGMASVVAGDHITFLSTFAIQNAGSVSSGPVTVHNVFDENNTRAIGVTDVRLLIPKKETAAVYFTMVDDQGNEYSYPGGKTVKNTGSNDKNGVLLSRSQLETPYNQYYFKTISYKIVIPGGTTLANTDAPKDSRAAGTVWGKVLTDTALSGNQRPLNHYYVYSGDCAAMTDKSGQPVLLDTKLRTGIANDSQGNQALTYGFQEVGVKTGNAGYTDSISISPGESAVIRCQLFAYRYPYTYRNTLDGLCVGLLLPADVTITDGITAKLKNGKTVDLEGYDYKPVTKDGATYNFWTIRLDPTVEIGYYGEGLNPISNGEYVAFTIPLQTELTTKSEKLVLNDILYAAGTGHQFNSGGIGVRYKKNDDYCMLGETLHAQGYDKVGGMISTAGDVSILIGSPDAKLDISDRLAGSETEDILSSHDQIISYELDIRCTQGGEANDFYYLIPVPKGSDIDDLVTASGLSLELTEAPVLTHSQGSSMLKLLYTTQTGLTYDTAQDAAVDWVEADGVTDWSQVTMVKAVAENPDVPLQNGTEAKIFVKYRYGDDEMSFARNAGQTITWNSRGYYSYRLGANHNAGNYSTDGITLTLNYTAPVQRITLTAAKDAEEAIKTAKVDLNGLIDGVFVNTPVFAVQDIETSGTVTLVPSNADFAAMGSEKSNTQFAIAAKLNEGTDHDLLLGETVGNLAVPEAGTAVFCFTIFNGDVITENATEKKVTLNLVGSNGATIPVEIAILRELTQAEPGEPGIIGGKRYTLFTEKETGVTVAANSAFTAQFVSELIPANYECPELSFTGSPKGKVIMIDWSGATPVYYQAEAGARIPLTAFTKIIGGGNYSYSTGEDLVKQSLLFIVERANTDGTITLTQEGKQDAVDNIIQTMNFIAANNRTFSLGGGGNVSVGSTVALNYSTKSGATGANESFYQDRSLALVLTGVDLPVDLMLKTGNVTYTRNAYGQFIIPLGNIQTAGNGSISITPVSEVLNPACKLTVQLHAAGASNGERPMGNDSAVGNAVTITIDAPKAGPGFKVLSMSDRIIEKNELGRAVTVKVAKANLSSSASVTMVVQVKEGNGYADRVAVLDSVSGLTSSNGENTLTLKFNVGTAPGTYRLLFTVTDGNTVLKIPYNFVVID